MATPDPGDFFEEDEPIEDVLRAFNEGRKVTTTARPPDGVTTEPSTTTTVPPTKLCPSCRERFSPKNSQQVYCHPYCVVAARNRRRREITTWLRETAALRARHIEEAGGQLTIDGEPAPPVPPPPHPTTRGLV